MYKQQPTDADDAPSSYHTTTLFIELYVVMATARLFNSSLMWRDVPCNLHKSITSL